MKDPLNEDDESVVIPFILTQKHGGEYDNEAFSAGWHLAILDAKLTIAAVTGLIPSPVALRTKWKAQADLIAMSHSLIVKTVPSEDPEFLYFIFGSPEFFAENDD